MFAERTEILSAKMEKPSDEMKRLIRTIGGKASAGEKDDQLRVRALRRMNLELHDDRQISERRSRMYWHGEAEDIPSDHMDRARELAFVQPIQEAEDAITTAEAFLAGLRARLETRAPIRRAGPLPDPHREVAAERRQVDRRAPASGMAIPVNRT